MKTSKIHNCEICNRVYIEPQSLSCGDTICKQCVENEKSIQKKTNFNCPLCKEEVTCYFLNKRLNLEVQEFKQSQCKIHTTEKIISFCENCNCNICKECSTSSNHRGHIFGTMTENKFELIFKEFKNTQYQSLLEYKKEIIQKNEEIIENFKNHNENSISQLKSLNSTFSILQSTLKKLETQIEYQIQKTQELNQLSNTKLTSLVTDVESFINTIINRNNKYFDPSISLDDSSIKQLYESNYISIVDDFSDTNNLLKFKSDINSNDFIKSNLLINNDNLSKFNEILNSIFKIETIEPQQPKSIISPDLSSVNTTTTASTRSDSIRISKSTSSSSSSLLTGPISTSENNSSNTTPPISKSKSVNNISKLGLILQSYTPSISKTKNNSSSNTNSSSSNSSSSNTSDDMIHSTIQSLPSISSIPSTNRISRMYSSNSNLNNLAANKDSQVFRWNLIDPIPPNTTSVCVLSSKDIIQVGSIPKKVTSLSFSGYNTKLIEGSIPDTILSLHLGHDYQQDIEPNILPSSITSLHLGNKFNKPLTPGMIPYGVLDLHIGDSYNQPIELGSLPSSILSLNMGSMFNQKLSPNVIPTSVSKLQLSLDFNQQISPGVIPSSVKILLFGYAYNQVILPGVLPNSIDTLELSYSFNQTLVQGCIPNVSKLTFGYHFNKPIKHSGIIPSTVTHLTYGSLFSQSLSKYVCPKTVQSLTLPDVYINERSNEISNIDKNIIISYRPKDF